MSQKRRSKKLQQLLSIDQGQWELRIHIVFGKMQCILDLGKNCSGGMLGTESWLNWIWDRVARENTRE